jgi:hypothetical protein
MSQPARLADLTRARVHVALSTSPRKRTGTQRCPISEYRHIDLTKKCPASHLSASVSAHSLRISVLPAYLLTLFILHEKHAHACKPYHPPLRSTFNHSDGMNALHTASAPRDRNHARSTSKKREEGMRSALVFDGTPLLGDCALLSDKRRALGKNLVGRLGLGRLDGFA